MKHTPGPWHVHDGDRFFFVDSATEGSVCKVAGNQNNDANARLIAAAPEMLEACQSVHTEIIGFTAYLETCSTEVMVDNLPSLIASLRRKQELIEAPICKARGE